MTGQHTPSTEAPRAGTGAGERQARTGQGQLWCSGCRDWHQAEAFPADGRRSSGRASTCRQAIQAAVRAELAAPAPPPSAAAVWVIRRPDPAAARGGGQAWRYWRGPGPAAAPGQDRAGAWSSAPGGDVARFPTAAAAREAIAAACGGPGAVPAGCRLARLALPRPGSGLARARFDGSVVDGAAYVIERDVPAAPLPAGWPACSPRPAPVP